MESLCRIHTQHSPLHLSLPSPSFSNPLLRFTFLPKTSSISKTFLKASPKPLPSLQKTPQNIFRSQKPQNPFHSLKPLSSLLKPISLSIAAAALLLARFPTKPSFAAAPAPAPQSTIESTPSDADDSSQLEKERTIKEYLDSHPDSVEALQALMETKIKLRKLPEAIDTVDRLILLQPKDKEWPLLRAHLHLYGGDAETAKSVFEDIIAADPFAVEAYEGLVMAVVQSAPDELDAVVKRIEDVMGHCKKEKKKKEELRDFRLLVAQVRVMEGKYEDALKIYQELVKEEPRDFRPYLCLGILYSLIGKEEDAEKQFVKYRRLVPKGHSYAQYLDQNVVGSKVFSRTAEKENVGSKR